MINVVIVIPAQALRAGIRTLLAEQPEIEILAEAVSLDEVDALPNETDLLVTVEEAAAHPALPDLLAELDPPLALLLLGDQAHEAKALIDLPLRAWGMLSQESSAEELAAAVQALDLGLVVGAPKMIETLLEQLPVSNPEITLEEDLTARELEVLQGLVDGLANKQIALELGISEHTIKFHVSSIYSKLNAANRTEAARLGIQLGLISL